MRQSATVVLALQSLVRNKARAVLTTLGVVIGVSAVILMVSLGDGATQQITQEISGIGANLLVVLPGARPKGGFGGPNLGGAQPFTQQDFEAIGRECPAVRYVAAYGTRILRAVVGERNWSTTLMGVTPDYLKVRAWVVSSGRPLLPEDERGAAKVCVIGQTLVQKLYGEGRAVGAELRLQRLGCQVVGVLAAKGTSTFGMDQDDVVMMPFSTFSRRISGQDRLPVIVASARSENETSLAQRQVESLLRQRRHIQPGDDDDFNVRDMREITALMGTVTGILTTVLAGVAAISLLVGGIGIMNIMLVSVTERTREIGIRLAVGARKADILRQFLVEAMVLSCLGGVMGIVLGLAGAFGAAKALSLPFVVSPLAVAIAFGVSAAVGVLFGVFPARKASRLRPIDALRFE